MEAADEVIAGWGSPGLPTTAAGREGSSSEIFVLHFPFVLAELSDSRTSPVLPPVADGFCPFHLLLVNC